MEDEKKYGIDHDAILSVLEFTSDLLVGACGKHKGEAAEMIGKIQRCREQIIKDRTLQQMLTLNSELDFTG